MERALVQRFVDHVMSVAILPPGRRAEIEQAPRFWIEHTELRCTCGITGSTYAAAWDGSEGRAMNLADEAAEGTGI